MDRLKRGFSFWVVLLLAAASAPATLLANKQLFAAKVFNGATGVGSSAITVNFSQYSYVARTRGLDNKVVKSAWLAGPCTDPIACVDPVTGPFTEFRIALCDGADEGEDDDCRYTTVATLGVGTGNLDIEGSIVPGMLMAAHINGRIFNNALQGGTLMIKLSDGVAEIGEGTYVRVFP